MFRKKIKSNYTPIYEVWEIRKGVYENIEKLIDYFYTKEEARDFITKERNRLFEIGGIKLAFSAEYKIKLGKEYHK